MGFYACIVCACSSAFTSFKLEENGQLFNVGLLVLGFCDSLPAALPSNMPWYIRTCMLEHAMFEHDMFEHVLT